MPNPNDTIIVHIDNVTVGDPPGWKEHQEAVAKLDAEEDLEVGDGWVVTDKGREALREARESRGE